LFQSQLFLDFLAGNQTYWCTPWGNPTRTVFGWQRPCYLLRKGYAKSFKELMEGTDWDQYGTANYEKCADCMVHSGYEPTAVVDAVKRPWRHLRAPMRGARPACSRPRRPNAGMRPRSAKLSQFSFAISEVITSAFAQARSTRRVTLSGA
jgi:hypothetical protein